MEKVPQLTGLAAEAPVIARATLRDGRTGTVRRAMAPDLTTMADIIRSAFSARRLVGAAPDALTETHATLAQALMSGSGYVALVDGILAGVTLVSPDGSAVRLGRVSVHPDFQRIGLAGLLVRGVLEGMAARDIPRVTLLARQDYPDLRRWWEAHGFVTSGEEGNCWVMTRGLPVVAEVPTAEAMRALGRALAPLVRAGDVLIASGGLGAGKTTFAQGLGEGMAVTGPILSPTFVLARVHPSTTGGPTLVHADAYRLGGFAELEDLDLEDSLDDSVTLIEWGEGVAEGLADDRLGIDIRRGPDPEDDTRLVFFTPSGSRWDHEQLRSAVATLGENP